MVEAGRPSRRAIAELLRRWWRKATISASMGAASRFGLWYGREDRLAIGEAGLTFGGVAVAPLAHALG
jgi:hypothetical protein